MGCASSRTESVDVEEVPRPESDVDVASVKDFDQEHKEAVALRENSRESSAASLSSRRSESPKKTEAEDRLSVKSLQGEIPPLTPPRHSKEELLKHHSFWETDELVRNAPSSATSSVTTLAFYLTSSSSTDLHSLRAIFLWLALNVKYDNESYLAGRSPPQEPGFILMCRKAVCAGFAQFCEVLCNLADIPCLTVRGIAKGYRHDPQHVYTQPSEVNHAWNLVLVQGEWRPLDCTWGAGFLRDDGTFCREVGEHWFLTDPVEFLPTHFPYMYRDAASSAVYQLVRDPVDLQTFSSWLKLDPLAYRAGLTPHTHQCGVIDDVKHDVTVKFNVTDRRLKCVTAYLTDQSDVSSKKDRSKVLTSWGDDAATCQVYVRPPRAATYLLSVMGQAEDNNNSSHRSNAKLRRMCVYVIRCTLAEPAAGPFPEISGAWGLQQPMAAECGVTPVKDASFAFTNEDGAVTVPLSLGRHTEVAVKLRRADEELSRYTFVEYGEDHAVEIRARLPEAGYFLLRVFASHPELGGLQHVADFLLFSRARCRPCAPFPVSSDFAHANRTRLLEPLARELARGATSLFRVRAPKLNSVRVNGVKMERRGFQGVWEAEVTPVEDGGKAVMISGSAEEGATKLYGLYTFDVV